MDGTHLGRLGDVLVGAAGDVAGSVVDPREGLRRFRATTMGKVAVVLGAGLFLGYLAVRRSRWT